MRVAYLKRTIVDRTFRSVTVQAFIRIIILITSKIFIFFSLRSNLFAGNKSFVKGLDESKLNGRTNSFASGNFFFYFLAKFEPTSVFLLLFFCKKKRRNSSLICVFPFYLDSKFMPTLITGLLPFSFQRFFFRHFLPSFFGIFLHFFTFQKFLRNFSHQTVKNLRRAFFPRLNNARRKLMKFFFFIYSFLLEKKNF